MSQPKSKTIEELAKLLSGVAAMQEKITMTEALARDLMVVLYAEDGGSHLCVEYDDDKLVCFSKDILRGVYDLRAEIDRLRKENAELRAENENMSRKSLFGRKKLADKR